MANETINISLTLSGTYWDRAPEYVVSLDDRVFEAATVSQKTGEKFVVSFDVELEDDTEHTLKVKLQNKVDSDTVENEEKTAIVKDMLLNIEALHIDGLDSGDLLWYNSEYFMDDGEYMKECVNLGRNGAWVFKFSCPFYIWLLEKM